MQKAKLFQIGNSQAIRLPREYQFDGEIVYVKKFEDMLILLPEKKPWDSLIKNLDKFSTKLSRPSIR